MIDLSHLTEEEQEAIMTVLRRDAELKKAEEERIRRLEKILSSGSQADAKLKYLTGEWFYEAKSHRHTDKIHGSEIILASMKQGKALSLDGSLRIDKPKISTSRSSDIVAPPKPARCFQSSQPAETNDAEKDYRDASSVRSPRMPRHNPFNRASLIVVDTPENNHEPSAGQHQDTVETELVSPSKNPSVIETSPTSDPVAFRPVPKKRTFLSRRTSKQAESFNPESDTQVASAMVLPAPRRGVQQGSNGSSEQPSYRTSREEPSPKVNVVSQPAQPSRPAEETFLLARYDASQISSDSSLERERHTSFITGDRPAVHTKKNSPIQRNNQLQLEDDVTQREDPALRLISQENSSCVDTVMTQAELSLPQSIVDADPPTSYDLHYIDKSNQPVQKANQSHVFKLSTQASSPTGEEEESIAKVLDWFSRSVDCSDWLDATEGPTDAKGSDKYAEFSKSKGDDLIKRQSGEDRKDKRTMETKAEAEGKLLQDVDEDQTPKISHLKSFWEKSNAGPKILIAKSVAHDENRATSEKAPVISSGPAARCEKKIPEEQRYDRELKLPISSDPRDAPHVNVHRQNNLTINSNHNDGLTPNTDHSKLRPSLEDAGRRSEIEAKRGPAGRTTNISGFQIVSELIPQPDDVLRRKETFQQEEPSRAAAGPQSDSSTPSRGSVDSEKFPRSHPYPDVQITAKGHVCRDPGVDTKKESEDRGVFPKAKEDTYAKANVTNINRQENTAERVKQLKSFWEQEKNKPVFFTGKPKPQAEGRVPRGANQAKLNKRFTKSEYDLRSLGNDSYSDEENCGKNQQNFTVFPMNQRLDKMPSSLSTSRSQFNTLREFWDEASSDTKGYFSHDKPKSPKRKEPITAQLPFGELKCGDAENCRVSSPVDKSRGVRSSPSKSPHDRQSGSKNNLASRRSAKDSNREEKPAKPQCSPRKEVRSAKNRRDSYGLSSRGSSLRRSTSMFALSVPDESEQNQLRIQVSPVHSQSRKQRQNADKSGSRRSSEEALTPPRARAFVPTDYRHYLGMSDGSDVRSSIAPAPKDEGSEGTSGYQGVEVGGPMRASTPVSGEERHSRRDSRAAQRPLWGSYSSSDTGQESLLSGTLENWSSSRKNREKDDDPVRKALWRAETRPKNLAKSLEDITGALAPRQERRTDPSSELRRISNATSIPSPSSSLHSDPDHLKNMSKSVPLFLQNEDAVGSPVENGFNGGTGASGSSETNLNGSSGMMSVSPLSGSVMTMYGGDFGNVEVQGNIQFSINYIQRLREFHIFVAECRDLAAVDPKRARSDPYVKSYLFPDKANLGKRKTSVKKKTLNPTFNEILRYRVRMEYLRTQTLILSVWHHDTFGRNSFLGEVDVELSKWDFDHAQMNYLALKARATPTVAPSDGRGEMRLSVRFLPQISHSEGKDISNTGEIHIWVKECKNLPVVRASIDPYVKCFVLPDTSRKSRQKTRVLRRTADPVFNHTMVYDGIREADLMEACVELTVWDRDRLASNLLGGVRLGSGTGRSYGAAVDWMDSTHYEVALWERMQASPNEWVEGVLPLRMLHSAKTALK